MSAMTGVRLRLAASVAIAALGLSACGGSGRSATSPGYKLPPRNGSPAHGEAGVGARPQSQRTTFLLSSANGAFPNGPSRNAAVSHDQRVARYIAYESDASNIVAGDTNNATDVFLVTRGEPIGHDGTPWIPGGTQLISKGLGGAPANGPSYRPALDGDSHHAPHCVAFVSAASNLVPGDTNGKPDGFVYDTRTQRITRVTVASGGGQSNGSTFDISITGDCERVAFSSDATNLALTRATKPAWSTAKTTSARPGTHQVYVHVLGGSGLDAGFRGLTFLASASNHGVAGNGDSDEVQIARSGKSVVFSSTATNLAKGDSSPPADVYRRTIFRKFQHIGHGKGVQTLQGIVELVSATANGKAGNGASTHPTVTDDGRYVAFQTDATNLLPGDSNGVTDIVRADLKGRRPKQQWVSKTKFGIGNGPSHDPVISDAGLFILFDSDASNLRPSAAVRPDPNGVEDVFLWNAPTRNVSLESRDADNGYLYSPSQHPATSSRGNYVPFESANPLIDLPLARRLFPKLLEQPAALNPSSLPQLSNPDVAAPDLPRAAEASGAAGAGQQVYLRYLGAK